MLPPKDYFFLTPCRCDNAEPAALLDAALVRPSCNTFEAAVAAFAEVTFEVCDWDNALPAAVFEFLPVEALSRTFDALWAAFAPVVLPAMAFPRERTTINRVVLHRNTKSRLNNWSNWVNQVISRSRNRLKPDQRESQKSACDGDRSQGSPPRIVPTDATRRLPNTPNPA